MSDLDRLELLRKKKRIIELRSLQSQQPQTAPSDLPVSAGGQSFAQAKPERSLGENLIGIKEAEIAALTGATGGAAGFGVGSIGGVLGELTGMLKPGEGLELAQKLGAMLTYEPRGEAGKEFIGDFAEVAGTLPPVLGTGPVVGLNALKGRVPKSKNRSINAISQAPESVQKSFTKRLAEDRFTPRIFGMVKEARKQGFDDSITTLIANSNKTNKRKVGQMVAKIEQGKGNARLKALEGVWDVGGDSLVKKIDYAENTKKQAGVQLDRVSKGLKGKSIDINEPIDSFFKNMDELGVKFDENGKPNFESAVFEGSTSAENLVNKIALRIKRNKGFVDTDGFKAHEFKKFIDENVSFEKSEGGLSGRVDRVVKRLRSGVNDSISGEFVPYKEANKRFSDNVTALDKLQDVAGQKLDFSGPNADKAAGVLLRSQLNNTGKRANLLTAIDDLEGVVDKYGGSFDDDIFGLSIIADELESVFGSRTRTAIRNEAAKGGVDAAIDISQMTLTGAAAVAAKAGVKKFRGINEANQLKAIKALLKEGK